MCFVLNLSGNRKKDEIYKNSTKIKFVNFVGNYSYKVNNIEKMSSILCVCCLYSASPENSIFLRVNKQENVVSKTISGKTNNTYE
jgi:hypothetical protein